MYKSKDKFSQSLMLRFSSGALANAVLRHDAEVRPACGYVSKVNHVLVTCG